MSKSNQTIATLNQAPRHQSGSVFTSTLDTNGCFIDELYTPGYGVQNLTDQLFMVDAAPSQLGWPDRVLGLLCLTG